jgi:hypothetical protein
MNIETPSVLIGTEIARMSIIRLKCAGNWLNFCYHVKRCRKFAEYLLSGYNVQEIDGISIIRIKCAGIGEISIIGELAEFLLSR